MNMPERSSRFQPPPPHRRKTPSFSSSLLDSILRSIDETTDGGGGGLRHDDQDLMFIYGSDHEAKGSEHIPSLRRAIMIEQWMDKDKDYRVNSRRKQVSYDLSSSMSGTTSSETETPSTYRSLPNSFTISRDNNNNSKSEGKFIKSTKLRAMKIYGKVIKQPISPGSRISAFLHSLFASSSKKKPKIEEETMQNLRSRSSINKQDATITSCTRSCMSKKQQYSISTGHVKRSVRFYPENGIHERGANSTPVPKYERNYTTKINDYNNFVVNDEEDEDDDEDEDDLFELEIVTAAGAYRQELPVFETTDLRKIRI